MKHPIIEELEEIISQFPNLGRYLNSIQGHVDPTTPSHEISLGSLMQLAISVFNSEIPMHQDILKPILKKVERDLIDRGYRNGTKTPQEHKLNGSSGYSPYQDDPYKPIGIITKLLTVEEARKARTLEKRFGAMGSYFCLPSETVNASMELLDSHGNTICDPLVLNKDLVAVETNYSMDFPFRRENSQRAQRSVG